MKPTIGRIVLYTLTLEDSLAINRRRTDARSIAERIADGKWPLGAQAHIGDLVRANDVYPMMITRVFPGGNVNGQVSLDGSDSFWVTGVFEGTDAGSWAWPLKIVDSK